MNLTFTTDRYGDCRGTTDSGVELFSIASSTRRGDRSVSMRCKLPGAELDTTVEPASPDGDVSSARAVAIDLAGFKLRSWAWNHLGVELDVNVIDNT